MGLEACPLVDTFPLDAECLALFVTIVARFNEHFVHPANELNESSRLHKGVQLPERSTNNYYAELCKLIKRWN